MANESLPSKRGYVWIKTESTYGSDPTLAAGADERYVEDWDSQAKDIMAERTGISPYRPGWRPVRVDKNMTFSGAVELTTIDVPTTDTTPYPQEDPFLKMCGFTRAWSGANAAHSNYDTFTYTLQSQGGESAAIEEYFFDEDHADGIGWQYLGCRADWTIELPAVGRSMLRFNGEAKTGTALAGPTPDGSLAYTATCPVVGGTWTVTLTELDGDTAFGGSIIEGTITGNMGLQRQMGQSGSVGPATIKLVPNTGIGFSLLVEQVVDGDWDPTTMLADKDASKTVMTASLKSTDSDTHYIQIDFTCALTDLELVADHEGRRAWTLNHSGAYPEASSDGGGLTPAENLTITYVNNTA
jgi:hypothetical protein